MSILKRINKIMNKQLTKIENSIEDNNINKLRNSKMNAKFSRELETKVTNSQSKIDSLRKSIQNTKL